MKKIIILLILIMFNGAFGQGFDWQYSARMPFKTATVFMGINIAPNYNISSGKINYIEDRFPCCNFNNGSGLGYIGGLTTELWTTTGISYSITVNFDYNYSKFTQAAEELPLADGSIFRTEYEFRSKAYYVDAEPMVKYKIPMSHFYIGASANLQFLISSTKQHFENVVSDNTFNDGSKTREIADGKGKISDLKSFIFQPKIRAGYDFSIGLGKYASVYVNYGIPIMDIAQKAEWKSTNISAGFCVYTSIF